jgi:hypothetical protein
MARPLTFTAILFLLLAPALHAQYKDYPQASGKAQPLPVPALPAWVAFDMDLRGRGEGQTAVNYIGGNVQDYFLTRARGGMQLRPTHWLTTYIQFMDTHALGLPLKYTASNMRDNFDIRQAWVEFHGGPVSAYTGRVELKYGDERIVGISDWTNNSRTFDGFLLRLGDRNRVDIFNASVVAVHPTALDMHAGGLPFSGIYGSINTWVPRTTIEPYIFMKALPSVLSQQKQYGTEREFTPGLHLSNNAPAGFDYVLEGNFQRGSYSNNSIHSGSGYVKLGYTAVHIPWSPRIQGEYDYATGNTHRDPQRISTFDQLYPSNHNAFGLVDLFGYQNIRQERINLSLTPHPHITLLIQQEYLNLATRHDSLYSGSGSTVIKAPAAGFATDSIGRGFDASMKYVIHSYWVINAGVGHFTPAEFMTENKHGAPLTLSFLGLTYRFRMDNAAHP